MYIIFSPVSNPWLSIEIEFVDVLMPAAAKSFGFTITLLLKSLYLTITDVEIDGLTLISTSCLPSIPWACLVWTVTVFLCNFPVITEKLVLKLW